MEQVPPDDTRRPIQIPIAGPGVPRYQPSGAVWLIPIGVVVATILAILCGALWQ